MNFIIKEKKHFKVHFIDVSIWGSNFIFFILGLLSMLIKSECPYKMRMGLLIFVSLLFLISAMIFMVLKNRILCIAVLMSFTTLALSYLYEVWIVYISVPVTLTISSIFKIHYFHKHKSEQFYHRINIFVFIPFQLIVAIVIFLSMVTG